MDRRDLRGSLLATSSAFAMVVGVGGAAWGQCFSNNTAPVTNSTPQNCIAFFDTGSHTGNVINNSTLTPPGTGVPTFAGTASGISIIKTTTLTGNITNNGTITVLPGGFAGINIGGNSFPVGTAVSGAVLNGSIDNEGTINGGAASIQVVGSTVTGNIINGTNGLLENNGGVGIDVIGRVTSNIIHNVATIGGSIINNGTINQGDLIVNEASTVMGGVTNNGLITRNTATVVTIALSTIEGSIVNNGTISSPGSTTQDTVLIDGENVGGSVVNNGTITGNYGFEIQNNLGTQARGIFGGPVATVINGNVLNTNLINATIGSSQIGIAVFGSTIGGVISNSGTISAGQYGILMVNLFGTFGTPTASGITNSGTITVTGSGFTAPGGIVLAGTSIAGSITNASSGNIDVPTGVGVYVGNATPFTVSAGPNHVVGSITNAGTITAKTGIAVLGGSTVTGGITNTGMISASGTGILLTTPGVSVFDSGTIVGGGGTAVQFGAGTNTMTLGPGWSITGTVAGAGADILDLGGSGTGTFNIGLLGTQFTGFTTFNTLSGTWDLTGTNSTFTGTLTITGGYLAVGTASSPNTTYGGSIVVDPGGTLSGHGTILGSVSNNGGTVLPGGSIGTLTIGGNFAQSASGTFVAQLTPAAASLLAVGGMATLNGTLEAAPAPGTYFFNSKYPIITAGGGVNGTFSTFINEMPSLQLSIEYLPNEVELVTAGVNFVGQTRNQTAVASALNLGSLTATGDFMTEVEAIAALPSSQQQQVLASLGGQIYANLTEVSLQNRELFLGAMDERMQPLGADGSPGMAASLVPGGWGGGSNATQLAMLSSAIGDRQGGGDPMNPPTEAQMAQAPAGSTSGLPDNVWARGFGQFGSLGNNGGALGGDYSTGGGAVGLDVIRTPQTILGLAASGGQSTLSTNSLPENATISFFQLGAYGAQQIGGGFALDGAFVYAHDFYDVSRGLVGLGRTATSSYGGDDAVVDAGLRRPFAYNGWQVTPRAGFTYYHIGQSQVTESGASSLDLLVNPAALDAFRSRVGFTVSQPMQWGGSQVMPELRAAWTHDFLDDRGTTLAALTGAPGVAFQQVGASTGRDAAELGAGLSFAIAQTAVPGHLAAFVEYDATVASHLTNNAFAAGLKLTW